MMKQKRERKLVLSKLISKYYIYMEISSIGTWYFFGLYGLLTENHCEKCGILPYELIVREVP